MTSVADGQGEAQVLDWLEVEDGASDWFNGFFTFLYGLINPLEEDEEQEERRSSGVEEAQDEEDEDEDEERVRQRRMKEQDKGGQKIIIVGLHNQ